MGLLSSSLLCSSFGATVLASATSAVFVDGCLGGMRVMGDHPAMAVEVGPATTSSTNSEGSLKQVNSGWKLECRIMLDISQSQQVKMTP